MPVNFSISSTLLEKASVIRSWDHVYRTRKKLSLHSRSGGPRTETGERDQWSTGIPETRRVHATPPSRCSAMCHTAMDSTKPLLLPSRKAGTQLARSFAIVPSSSILYTCLLSNGLRNSSAATDRATSLTASATASQ